VQVYDLREVLSLPLRTAGNHLLVLVALAAMAVPWYLVGREIADAKPAVRSLAATGIVWGDRVFTARAPLSAWLHRRGVAYVVWARRHPPASRVIAGG
jgi:hypothetical protein